MRFHFIVIVILPVITMALSCDEIGHLGSAMKDKAKYDDAVDSGIATIPTAREMDSLGNCDHYISYYKDGPQVWNSELLLAGTYRITYQCDISLNSEKSEIVSHNNDKYCVDIIDRVDNGTEYYSTSYEFGEELWREFALGDYDPSIFTIKSPGNNGGNGDNGERDASKKGHSGLLIK